jgi:hypothetical protein
MQNQSFYIHQCHHHHYPEFNLNLLNFNCPLMKDKFICFFRIHTHKFKSLQEKEKISKINLLQIED